MIEGAQDRRGAYIRGRRKQDGSCAERHACRNGEKSSASLMDDRRLSFWQREVGSIERSGFGTTEEMRRVVKSGK